MKRKEVMLKTETCILSLLLYISMFSCVSEVHKGNVVTLMESDSVLASFESDSIIVGGSKKWRDFKIQKGLSYKVEDSDMFTDMLGANFSDTVYFFQNDTLFQIEYYHLSRYCTHYYVYYFERDNSIVLNNYKHKNIDIAKNEKGFEVSESVLTCEPTTSKVLIYLDKRIVNGKRLYFKKMRLI